MALVLITKDLDLSNFQISFNIDNDVELFALFHNLNIIKYFVYEFCRYLDMCCPIYAYHVLTFKSRYEIIE